MSVEYEIDSTEQRIFRQFLGPYTNLNESLMTQMELILGSLFADHSRHFGM